MKTQELSPEDLAAMGFTPKSPEEQAALGLRREAQITATAQVIRESAEAKIAAGWAPEIAFDAAVHAAAKSDARDEATVQMMTLACSILARNWEHSVAFVEWWNALFPNSPRCSGFANPAVMELENGQSAAIIAPWSGFMSMTQRQQA